jgi:hypothetical protein
VLKVLQNHIHPTVGYIHPTAEYIDPTVGSFETYGAVLKLFQNFHPWDEYIHPTAEYDFQP